MIKIILVIVNFSGGVQTVEMKDMPTCEQAVAAIHSNPNQIYRAINAVCVDTGLAR
jgi:hypothetical protein